MAARIERTIAGLFAWPPGGARDGFFLYWDSVGSHHVSHGFNRPGGSLQKNRTRDDGYVTIHSAAEFRKYADKFFAEGQSRTRAYPPVWKGGALMNRQLAEAKHRAQDYFRGWSSSDLRDVYLRARRDGDTPPFNLVLELERRAGVDVIPVEPYLSQKLGVPPYDWNQGGRARTRDRKGYVAEIRRRRRDAQRQPRNPRTGRFS